MQTLILIDDRLSPETQGGRIREIVSLLQEALAYKCTVLGFDPDKAIAYLKEKNNPVDLIVCDHNLWWGKQDDGSYEYRYGHQFMEKLRENRGQLPPVVIFSDDDRAPGMWRDAGIEYEAFVPKWGKEFENLLSAISLKLQG